MRSRSGWNLARCSFVDRRLRLTAADLLEPAPATTTPYRIRRAEIRSECLSEIPGTLCADFEQLCRAQHAYYAVRNAWSFRAIRNDALFGSSSLTDSGVCIECNRSTAFLGFLAPDISVPVCNRHRAARNPSQRGKVIAMRSTTLLCRNIGLGLLLLAAAGCMKPIVARYVYQDHDFGVVAIPINTYLGKMSFRDEAEDLMARHFPEGYEIVRARK